MTTFNTGNPVPSANAKDRYDNSQTFDEFVSSQNDYTVTRLGYTLPTMWGMANTFNAWLAGSAFEAVHLVYVDGSPLTVNRPTQLIDRAGSVYRIKLPSSFPLTLTGNFAVDSAKLVDNGDLSVRQALLSTNLSMGVSMVAGATRTVATLAVLKAIPTLPVPQSVTMVRYVANGPICDSTYDPDPTDTTTVADDCATVRTTAGLLYRLRHKGVLHLAQAGGMMNGATVDTPAWNRALATAISKIVFDNVSITSAPVVHPNGNTTIEGLSQAAILRSQDNTNHETTLLAAGKTGIRWIGFTVDANSPNRMNVLETRTVAGEMRGCFESFARDMTFMNAVGNNGIPGIGFSSGGAGEGVHTYRCKFIDCGIPGKAADGIFCSSRNSTNTANVAIRCNDTGHVVESTHNSGHTDFTSIDCGAAAAISNAIGTDTYGQYLRGGTVRNWTSSVTGGIQILTAGAGSLRGWKVSDITMAAVSNGVGPALQCRETGTGRVRRGSIDDVTIEGGTTQGMLISGVDISITNPQIGGTTSAPIQVQGADSRVNVSGGTLTGGVHGMVTTGNARLISRGVVIESPTGWGGFAFGTSTIIDFGSYVLTPGQGAFSKDATATLNRLGMTGNDLSSSGLIAGAAAGTQASKLRVLGPNNQTLGYLPIYPS